MIELNQLEQLIYIAENKTISKAAFAIPFPIPLEHPVINHVFIF